MQGDWDDEEGDEVHICDFGETFSYHCCLDCNAFRDSVRDYEINEGCPPDSIEPYRGDLIDSIQQHESVTDYIENAVMRYPYLVNSRVMGAISRSLEHWRD